MKTLIAILAVPVVGFMLVMGPLSRAIAKEEYATETGKGCSFCHQESKGGPLKPVGLAFIRNNYDYPIPKNILEKAQRIRSPFHRTLHFIFGYLHLLTSCIFVGAIFYVHIFIKPSRITGGIPKGERRLGIACLTVLTGTGIYLTWLRIDSLHDLFRSNFGVLLFSKLVLFCLMLLTALMAVTIIHKRMRKEAASKAPSASETDFTIEDLQQYDGTSGRPAYIAFENDVYDVTKSPKWNDGRHMGRHAAGRDLTNDLKGAPHGEEVLQNLPRVGKLSPQKMETSQLSKTRKLFVVMAYSNLIIVFLMLACVSSWRWGFPVPLAAGAERESNSSRSCLGCHQKGNPGIFNDWNKSVHSKVGVTCYSCHKALEASQTTAKGHLNISPSPVSTVVSPTVCAGCHPNEHSQYARSKHANTRAIMWKVDKWLQHGMNNEIERTTGCYSCHGSEVMVEEGEPVDGSWPNVGVGRINPDGSLGSCTSCHTRHTFSTVEARKPEACDQCHLGPDHPQIEIYNESKHGTIYHAEGDQWSWSPQDGRWLAGRDYRSPTCASCHISEAIGVDKTHDVTQRLSWELQAPLTIRPENFEAFPSKTSWEEERAKMKRVCKQCHSETWAAGHFDNLDKAVENYNEVYYRPMVMTFNDLYESGLLSREIYFDEELEWEFYEFWHHEGRRARMGAAMMAPDYAWWHGFYELKHRFTHFMEEADRLKRAGSSKQFESFPGQLRESP